MKDTIVVYGGYKAKVTNWNQNGRGVGIVYLEGPRKGWDDWIACPNVLKTVEPESEN